MARSGQPRHARRDWANILPVALGLAAMVVLPLIVVSLVPSGLGGTPVNQVAAAIGTTPRFGPVTIEAESPGNRVDGSAKVDSYRGASGGRIVRAIGSYGKVEGPGILRFAVVVPAAGTYALTFFYVHVSGEPLRTATITVDDAPGFAVTVAGSAICCASASVDVHLRRGANSVAFANRDGHAPSIDRITISAG
jgi:hypothetical protein